MTKSGMQKLAFKTGFLRGLAECGVLPSEFFAHVKRAFDPTGFMDEALDIGKSAVSGGSSMAGAGLKALGTAALAAPLAVGGASGAAEALLNAPEAEDIENLRKTELLGLYRRLTDEIKARKQKGVV